MSYSVIDGLVSLMRQACVRRRRRRRRRVSVTLCIVAERCVLEQKLLLTGYIEVIYEKSIGTKMNDLDLCLEVVQGHVNHCGVNISKTTSAIETSNLVHAKRAHK